MQPLSGIVVLDLSPNIVGHYATQALADLGARVISIARPGTVGVHGRAGQVTVGRNKESIFVDLKDASGRDLFLRLAKDADVVVDGFRPGVADRLGIGPERLREANPQLVYCSLTGYGLTGPYASWPGHDLNYQGVGGFLPLGPDGEPALATNNWADREGSVNVVLATLAGLLARERTGLGSWLDVSLLDAVVAVPAAESLGQPGYERVMNGGPPGSEAPPSSADDILRGVYPWYGVYRCADGFYVTVCAAEPWFWQRLCAWIGRPEWSKQQFADDPLRGEMFGELRRAFGSRSRSDLLGELLAADLPVAPVNVGAAVVDDEHLRHRQMVREVSLPSGRAMWQIGAPFQMVGSNLVIERPVTPAGSDTRAVVGAVGIPTDEIDALFDAGVLGE